MKVAITGSSGLIGRALTNHLRLEGHEVLRLVRRAPRAGDEVGWRPRPPDGATRGQPGKAGSDGPAAPDGPAASAGAGRIDRDTQEALRGLDAAVHLAGEPIGSGRWTDARKREILTSRVEGTQNLAALLASLPQRPAVLLSGSATGWYGDTGDRAVDESGPPGRGFLATVAQRWEAATAAAQEAGIRVVRMRTGIVLSKDGGVLGRLLPLFRAGLGARLGPGTQFMSWIALSDLVETVSFLLASSGIDGPVNLTAPHPVTNAQFTVALGRALRRPAILRVPSRLLDAALGEAAQELLASSRVVPARLLEAGYAFGHSDIDSALASELQTR